MKKAELKNILKPLVKECVREAIFDEGILSGIISEVARGMGAVQAAPPGPRLVEQKEDPTAERMKRNAFSSEQSTKLKEHKTKLMSAIGATAYNGINLFEGTTPGRAQGSETQMASPLASQDPGDPGVDISNLLSAVGTHWNAHLREKE